MAFPRIIHSLLEGRIPFPDPGGFTRLPSHYLIIEVITTDSSREVILFSSGVLGPSLGIAWNEAFILVVFASICGVSHIWLL